MAQEYHANGIPLPIPRSRCGSAIYWPRHTGRWHRYEDLDAASDVGPLLAEIDADPDGVFWG